MEAIEVRIISHFGGTSEPKFDYFKLYAISPLALKTFKESCREKYLRRQEGKGGGEWILESYNGNSIVLGKGK